MQAKPITSTGETAIRISLNLALVLTEGCSKYYTYELRLRGDWETNHQGRTKV